MANRKRERRRKYQTRITKKKIIILCEGEKTEIIYFRHYKKRNSLVEIEPVPSKGNTAVRKIIEFAQNKRNWQKWNFNPDEGDLLYCVYDKDQNSEIEMNNAFKVSQQNSYLNIFPSNPCFEVWYILHYKEFAEINSTLNPQEIKELLKTIISNYQENLDVFQELSFIKSEAIRRINNRFKYLSDIDKLKYRKGILRPSTNIHLLIDFLEKLK